MLLRYKASDYMSDGAGDMAAEYMNSMLHINIMVSAFPPRLISVGLWMVKI